MQKPPLRLTRGGITDKIIIVLFKRGAAKGLAVPLYIKIVPSQLNLEYRKAS